MSFQKAINEIASLLTQGGVPSNHAQDVAARLGYALSSYYDSRQNSGNSQEVTESSSKSASFRRAFRSPEEYPGGRDGAAGADGQWAWAVGEDGKDGEKGDTGADGSAGRDGVTTVVGGGGGLSIDISRVPCGALESKLKSCGLSTGKDGEDGKSKCPPGGPFPGLEICSILDQQAKELGKQRKKIEELEDKIKDIEKQLKDTVDCPAA
jgi:hypothetical protein